MATKKKKQEETITVEQQQPETKSKDFCVFEFSTGKFLEKVTFTYQGEKEPEEWERCETLTDVIPDQQMLDAMENGVGIPIFDKKTKTWSLQEPDAGKLTELIENAKAYVNRVVLGKMREGVAQYSGLNFYYNRRKCNEYIELFMLASNGIVDFPISIKSAGSNITLEFANIEEYKKFMRFIYDTKMNIINIGRALKYGGTIAGIELKPLSEFTIPEICQFKASESMEMLLELVQTKQ